MYDQDPWAWANQQKQVAPLSASIQPAQDQAPGVLYEQPSQLEQMAVAKGTQAGEKAVTAGWDAYKAANVAQSVAPLSAGNVLGTAAPAMSFAPAATTAATEGLMASGVTGLAAPLASTAATGAGILGTEAAVGSALASTAAPIAAGTTAAGAGLGAAGSAGLAALGPVGLLIGAGLLAKKLKLF
jgi:hypothetical protein